MSANVIASLYAFAETSGLPPCVNAEHAFADASEAPVVEQTDVRPTDLICEDAEKENLTIPADDPAILPDTPAPAGDPDIWLYRKRTVGVLRRYMRLSIEVGRLPSLRGRVVF